MIIDREKEETAAMLKGSLLYFTEYFFEYMTGRKFVVSKPSGRESHHIAICKHLTKLFYNDTRTQRLVISVPPGHGKSTLMCMWVAWCYAHYSDCNFLYISYSLDLAASHTFFIKQIMSSEMYRYFFDIHIDKSSRAKSNFSTTTGGCVAAFGSEGAITGRNAGLPGLDRFSGAVIIDDSIKPGDAHSDTIRNKVNTNFSETIRQRVRGTNVPIACIAQRLHEDDLPAQFINRKDTREWNSLVLKSIDDAGNVLCPEIISKEDLLSLQEKSPYVFSSQYQQDPLPAGGGLFKKDWFVELDEYPEILATFITADTAETAKTYNDATAISFWGLYEIKTMGRNIGRYALHSIDCINEHVEPKDLENLVLDFIQECMRFKTAPSLVAIEKKSTGVTLVNVLKNNLRGMRVLEIERSSAAGSKTDRFLSMQQYIASKLVSINSRAKHKDLFINHMSKITANDTHRFDDIADTCYDAIKIAFIDEYFKNKLNLNNDIDADKRKYIRDSLRRNQKIGAARNA